MDGLDLILVLLVGLAIGVALGWMLARGRVTEARADARAAEERATYVEEHLGERFRSLSAEALDATNQRFLELAEGRLRAVGAEAGKDMEQRRAAVEQLVSPLKDTLSRVESQLRETDAGRRAAHAELAQQVDQVRQGSDQLRDQTQALVSALRRPEARGRWGELQLRRVAELAGMSAYCDFEEQADANTDEGRRRPDMVVRLAGGKNIVVDSKVSLAAYLEAVETDDSDTRAERLRAHSKHLRAHVDQLAAKSYWAAFSPAPEFVVLFVPGEAFLAPALEHDPQLLEHAMGRRVHIATPTTLISLLRTAQYAWQQEALSENARAVFELGKQLHARLSTLGGHVEGLGKALSRTVTAYNQTVGSLESRVLVTARRFEQLGLVDGDLARPDGIQDQARPPAASELTGEDRGDGGDGGTDAENGTAAADSRVHLYGAAFAAGSAEAADGSAGASGDTEGNGYSNGDTARTGSPNESPRVTY
ncbi:DNA recombination protein RmuC [Streptomonospora litoralis]|uniref:DNA recombination protein RmuC n=1 Tax=Streptomonospora litoralis TaxID=2498135 RepID=A0A4P6Q1E4_9ACTN|nr:DNA recombination protein RmuC [Streptomonospora litoralis]QBI52524.1 DNA recombination protein RmuC [Streptomonospora litoralis]